MGEKNSSKPPQEPAFEFLKSTPQARPTEQPIASDETIIAFAQELGRIAGKHLAVSARDSADGDAG